MQDGVSGGRVTWLSYLSQMPPDRVLFCSLDDDSDLCSPRYSFSEDTKSPLSVPRSKSEMSYIDGEKVVKRSATLPLPTRSSSLKSSPER